MRASPPTVSEEIERSYSVRNAVTGSFFAAMRAGMRPAKKVKNILITTRMTPPTGGNAALMELMPEK